MAVSPLTLQTWELPLLSRAQEAYLAVAGTATPRIAAHNPRILERAYDYCERVTAAHSRSFYWATQLLPREKRQAIRALYAFCRVSDDIVDRPRKRQSADQTEHALLRWRRQAMSQAVYTDMPSGVAAHDLIAVAWADTRARYAIPACYAEQLIDGVARDFQQTRYRTFAELAAYAYGVASTVGLMSMHVIGYASEDAIPYAIKLGVALQLTNILRDVGEDWRSGRLYLPLGELDASALTEEDIAAGRVDERWRAFMRFQIARTRCLYAEAWPGISLLNRDGRFAVAAASELYRAILDDIAAHDYDVFSRRAHIGAWGKLRRLLLIGWRSR
jgi:phytoene synthase